MRTSAATVTIGRGTSIGILTMSELGYGLMKRYLSILIGILLTLFSGCGSAGAPATPTSPAATRAPATAAMIQPTAAPTRAATATAGPGAALAPTTASPSPAIQPASPTPAPALTALIGTQMPFTPSALTPAPTMPRAVSTPEPIRTVTVDAGQLQGKLVNVGDHRLYIECMGSGSPTVILEHGLGSTGSDWSKALGEIAQFTRVCAYDRAGVGRSEAAPPGVRTSQMMVDDLHQLLVNAGLVAPYVLVGHSFGGMNLRLYAYQHPEVVAGLVLVDALHPEQWQRWQALLPTPTAGANPALPRLHVEPIVPGPERVDLPVSAEQIQAAAPLDALPLVVITAGALQGLSDLSAELADRFYKSHLELQQELAQLSTNSVHVVATGSGHSIQQDQPYLVATAVHQVVTAARNDIHDLPPCELIYPAVHAECQRVPRQ